jgi:glucosamine-6-phosphate deaminase
MKSHAARISYADRLEVRVFEDAAVMGSCAAEDAAATIRAAIGRKGRARITVATGASQFAYYEALTRLDGIDWSKVEVFHLDEYVGIAPDHPASFRRYLHERFVERVRPSAFHELKGEAEPPAGECARYAEALAAGPIDMASIGIGENGHLAFNDPPVADFDDPEAVKVVELDEACRRQQLGEGWFPTLEDVPRRALTQTIPAILGAGRVICIVPDERKARAVSGALTGPVSTACPASVLRGQRHCTLYLDRASASLIKREN